MTTRTLARAVINKAHTEVVYFDSQCLICRKRRGDRWLMGVKRSSNGKRVGNVCVFARVTDTQNEQDSMST